ncbi:MAG: putative sulfate/molybdate transporter [Candidatus Thorarchaeota archaeon]
MVKFKGFQFSISEFAGSLGDFGTLMPFTVGYIVLCGFKPTGLMLGIGLTNILLGLIYNLPLPVQPQKVIGTVALAEKWAMRRVLGAGFAVGLIWVILSLSERLRDILERIPSSVVRGIQLGLAFSLALTAGSMMEDSLILSLAVLALGLLLLRSRYLPSAIFLMLFGFIYATVTGNLNLGQITIGLSLPEVTLFSLGDMVYGFLYAGLAQIFLTLTNAVVSTVALIHELFPDRKDVTPRKLIANMGAIDTTTPFIGGMPLCHGTGGLAAQYLFGARTGGSMLIEGVIEISLGLFFSNSLQTIFEAFPDFIIGVMLLLTSLELGRIAFKIEKKNEIPVLLFTALISTVLNIAYGFMAGILLYLALKKDIVKLEPEKTKT